ncbi:uncharacterized protein LOC135695947, partial [Rhopilema esculentum]|uniref:uncharacterized protein LOC135695947 n=1 Tax=Rhopilema esculentum TaxID=499914 RepID=UPI0031D84B39
MQVSSLEYIASLTIKRFLVDKKKLPEDDSDCRVIWNQIHSMPNFHVHLERILEILVERQPKLVTDSILKLLLSGKFHFKRLILKGCSSLTLEGFSSAIQNQPHIKHLDISSCENLADASLGNVLALHLQHLESLSFESCDNLCDDIVKVIISKCAHIKYLSLACSPCLTDEMFNFESFVQSCKDGERILSSLSRIDLSGCQGISSKSVRNLFSLCGSTLESVDISWTKVDCTALVYLSGFSLSSAVFIATHADEKNLPCSVAELEASQEFEFQMIKEMNKSDSINSNSQRLSEMFLVPTEKDNNIASGGDLAQKTESIVAEIVTKENGTFSSFCESINPGADHFEQENHPCVLKDGFLKQCIFSYSSQDNHYADTTSSACKCQLPQPHKNGYQGKLANTYHCSICNLEGRNGLRRAHSFSCISEDIQKTENKTASTLFSNPEHYYDKYRKHVGILASTNNSTFNIKTKTVAAKPRWSDTETYHHSSRINNFVSEALGTSNTYTTWNDLSNEYEKTYSKIVKESSTGFEGEVSSNCKNFFGNDPKEYSVVHGTQKSKLPDLSEVAFLCPNKVAPFVFPDVANNIGNSAKSFTSSESFYQNNQDRMKTLSKSIQISAHDLNLDATRVMQKSVISSEQKYGSEIDKSEIEAKLSAAVEFYKPRQMLVSHITELDISQISFYDSDVGKDCIKMFVHSNHSLTSLCISWTGLTDAILEEIARNEPRLIKLGLPECECLSNSGIIAVGLYCKNLQILDLQGVPFISDRGLLDVLSSGLLEELTLAECAITDTTLRNIANYCSLTITRLDLSWCENITDESLCDLVNSCPKLEYLNVRQCEISTKTVAALPCISGKLTHLGLCSIKDLTDSQAVPMVRSLRNLTFVDLSWNCMLTDDTISTLLGSCPMLNEAVLAGLKRITSKPFLPIISDRTEWRSCLKAIRSRIRRSNYAAKKGVSVSDEVLDNSFYLPYRSLHYAPNLCKLGLSFSDKVNDT